MNLVFLVALPLERDVLAVAWTPVLRASFSIIGSRIILNLKGAAKTDPTAAIEMSRISYAERSGHTNSDGSGTLVGSRQA